MHSEANRAKWKQNKDECGTFLRFSRFCLLLVLAHETEEVFLFLFPSQQLLPSLSFQSGLNVFSEGRDMIHQCMRTDCNNTLFTSRANWDRTWHFLRTGDQKTNPQAQPYFFLPNINTYCLTFRKCWFSTSDQTTYYMSGFILNISYKMFAIFAKLVTKMHSFILNFLTKKSNKNCWKVGKVLVIFS